MNDGHLLVAFHGCDVTVRDDLVAGRIKPKSSKNRYDWLGPGFYLFENDAERAAAFAATASAEPSRRLTSKLIATPAVVGCVLNIQRCLDMTTRPALREFELALPLLMEVLDRSHTDRPENRAASEDDSEYLLRHLDNAVLTYIHQLRDAEAGGIHYQAVRGAFRQGAPIAENSGFHQDSHVQIALRDTECIVGFFLPPGEKLLSDQERVEAGEVLDEFVRAHPKPRVRR